jgi:hypothetical protein
MYMRGSGEGLTGSLLSWAPEQAATDLAGMARPAGASRTLLPALDVFLCASFTPIGDRL